jgi:hypothetical protein
MFLVIRLTVLSLRIMRKLNMTVTPVAETFELAPAGDYRILHKQLKKDKASNETYLAIRLRRI